MSGSSPSQPPPATTITDLDEDSLACCAAYLNPRDVSNLAMTCTSLKRLAYSDSIWLRLFRKRWHQKVPSSLLNSSRARDLYLAQRTALQQFKFNDPLVVEVYEAAVASQFNNLLLHKNQIFSTQGSLLQKIDLDKYQKRTEGAVNELVGHKSRITCMRLFSLNEISSSLGETEKEQNLLVTSSCDHTIRVWRKGSCMRCLRGHNGPVLSLSNKLLGEDGCKILASGGEDGTVRLWSLGSSGNRGQHALKATFYGHEKPVNLMSVAGHKNSLLVTISRDAKVRIWDTAKSSGARSSCCVGMTSVTGTPVNMKCHESLLYVAAGSSVTVVDLRTMENVITTAVGQPKLYSFSIIPSKSLICTGGDGSAMLWDIRRNQEVSKPEPVAELYGHGGPVTLLHMDSYKTVTGSPRESFVHVWETDTGALVNSMFFFEKCDIRFSFDAMAVDGLRIATAMSSIEAAGALCFRDFTNAISPVVKAENSPPSKFWDSLSGDHSDDDDR